MNVSKSKLPRPPKLPDIDFADVALKAMKQAQRVAARENARYGLPLIVQNFPSPGRGGRTQPGA